MREALGISKASQLPIALTATLTRAQTASIDFRLAGTLSVTLIVGMLVGSRAAAIVSAGRHRHTIGYVLACVGIALLIGDVVTVGR